MRKIRSGTHMKVLNSKALINSMYWWDRREAIKTQKLIDKCGILIYNYRGDRTRTYSYNRGYSGPITLPNDFTEDFTCRRHDVEGLKLEFWPKKEKKNAK